MPYLVDTDLVIDHLANITQANQLLDKLAAEGIAISIITYMEAYQGVVRSPNIQAARAKSRHSRLAALSTGSITLLQRRLDFLLQPIVDELAAFACSVVGT